MIARGDVTVAKMRTGPGCQGTAYTLDVLVRGRPAIHVGDFADGGDLSVRVLDEGLAKELDALVATLPPAREGGFELPCDLGLFVESLVNEELERRLNIPREV